MRQADFVPVCLFSPFLAPSLPAAQDRKEKLVFTRIFYCLFIQYYYYYYYYDLLLLLLLVLFSLTDPSKYTQTYKHTQIHTKLGKHGGRTEAFILTINETFMTAQHIHRLKINVFQSNTENNKKKQIVE